MDYGAVRTGLALSDIMGSLASPLCVITQRNFEKLIDEIANMAQTHKAEQIIVGLPLNMDGSHGESAQKCALLAEQLREKTALPVHLADERNTTKSAALYLNDTNTRGQKRKNLIDAAAAAVLLQSYLDSIH